MKYTQTILILKVSCLYEIIFALHPSYIEDEERCSQTHAKQLEIAPIQIHVKPNGTKVSELDLNPFIREGFHQIWLENIL